ncbi:MAG: energy transducer TonB [Candidatus Cloacimonetes bacterium]|nr:energy transducer TonB [Candidatus Cloacimonadota bacterium]
MKKYLIILTFITILSIILNIFPTQLYACIRCEILAQLDNSEIVPPQVINRTPLYYPQELQDELIMGRVVLEVTVLADSTIGYIGIIESVPELDSLAIANVMEWTFEPAYRDDEPTIGLLTVEVNFIPDFLEIDEEIALADTIMIDTAEIERLQDKIEKFIDTRQEPINHSLNLVNEPFYCENYHIISWQRRVPYIKRDNFSIIPSQTLSSHIFQNYYPLYKADVSKHSWSFSSTEYTLPVTFIEGYAGIGFLDMDFAHINLGKNNALNIDDLQIWATLLFQDGFWMGVNEKSTNLAINLKYPLGRHRFYWNSLFISQDIPPVKISNQYEYITNLPYEEKINEHSVFWENPYLNLGLRYETMEYRKIPEIERPERTLYQLLLNRTLHWRNHRINLQYEYFDIDETEFFSYPYLTTKHKDIRKIWYSYGSDQIKFETEAFSGMGFNYHSHSQLSYHPAELYSVGLGLLDSEPRFNQQNSVSTLIKNDLYATLNINTSFGHFKTSFGQRKQRQYGLSYHYLDDFLDPEEELISSGNEKTVDLSTPYVSGEFEVTQSLGVTDWLLAGFVTSNVNNELDYLPRWYGKTNLECRYNLLHNNAITAGLIYLHTEEYYTPIRKVPATNVLDGYIRISITRLFDIQADAKNLLETDAVFGYPVAGIHWNLGIRWFFFN